MPPTLPPMSYFAGAQRVVILIDLHPLLALSDPSTYLSSAIAASARLLRSQPICNTSLAAHKLFISSLSPLRSASALPRHFSSESLSFDLPLKTLNNVTDALGSFSTLVDRLNLPSCPPRAEHVTSSLLQLIHDYAWESVESLLDDDAVVTDPNLVKFPRNLVFLFSDVNSFPDLSADEVLSGSVKGAFTDRDIRLCWVDVRTDVLRVEERGIWRHDLENLKDEVKRMGFGFCSSDLISLGSALVPFELIYPKIGASFDCINSGEGKKCSGELDLKILDVNGKPLECKWCDLDFVSVKSSHSSASFTDNVDELDSRDSPVSSSEDALWLHLGNGRVKLHVKGVYRYDEHEFFGGLSENVLVREHFEESNKKTENSCIEGSKIFADTVLEMVRREMDEVTHNNQIPTWQIFLSFLYSKGYWALVSLSSGNGNTFMGSLKPFTAHWALVSISYDGSFSVRAMNRSKSSTGFDPIHDSYDNSNRCLGSQTSTSTSGSCEPCEPKKTRKGRKHMYHVMTWDLFYKEALKGSTCDLFEVYTAHLQKSKKLKFFKCWMKQIEKVDPHWLTTLPEIKPTEDSSACSELPELSPAENGDMPISVSETVETFLCKLSKRIQQGLESGMELQILAQRVLRSFTNWLRNKSETETNAEVRPSETNLEMTCNERIEYKLIDFILKEPREMKKIPEDFDSSSSTEILVREYELQIFFRIEILRSTVTSNMEESRKEKLLKQICSLLEIIQFLVAGGIHGQVSLYDYVERTIRARYGDELEDIFRTIYTKMDLLPFGDDDDETPIPLLNSDDSNQSYRDIIDRNKMCDSNSNHRSLSQDGESMEPLLDLENEHKRLLDEAQERRERARNFAPFRSRARELQRVWALKVPKANSQPKRSKRKEHMQEPPCSIVHETPMTGNKHFCSEENNVGNKDDSRISACSVSKALFQDK